MTGIKMYAIKNNLKSLKLKSKTRKLKEFKNTETIILICKSLGLNFNKKRANFLINLAELHHNLLRILIHIVVVIFTVNL